MLFILRMGSTTTHKDGNVGYKAPKKDDVKQYFIKMWGEIEPGMKWSGFKIRRLEDDIANGDAYVIPIGGNGNSPM